MPKTQLPSVGENPSYWTHNVDDFPGPVAQFRMSQLIDFDDRLYENARIVYRFIVGWYHDGHGDALLSMRRVSEAMRQRAPSGAKVLSHSVVARAIETLVENGWIVCTAKGRGKGKGASRYVPTNVLGLAAEGKFPQPSHSGGTAEPSRPIGTEPSHSIGTDEAQLSRVIGTKTQLPDSATEPMTGSVSDAAPGASSSAGASGFDAAWTAYGKVGTKTAARVAWAAIDPDSALSSRITARAASWAASAKTGTRRMPFERWLVAEKWDEADRAVRHVPRLAKGVVRRDVTVTAIDDHPFGRSVTIRFHDCEPGDVPEARVTEEQSVADALSIGTRYWADFDPDGNQTWVKAPTHA